MTGGRAHVHWAHSDWDNLVHTSIDAASKDVIKQKLGLQQVPFYIVVGRVSLGGAAAPAVTPNNWTLAS
jgi:hypothetical protein